MVESIKRCSIAYPSLDGQGLMAITFKNDDGKKETIYAPTNQIKVDGLNRYTSKQIYKVWQKYGAGRFGNLPSFKPDEFIELDVSSEFAGKHTVDFRYSEEKIYILDTDKESPNYGTWIVHEIDEGLNKIADSLEDFNQTL